MATETRRTIKVAVVGSGLAGLTSAYLLANFQPRPADVEFDVHVFEKSSVLGMDSESLTVKVPGNSEAEKEEEIRVDAPMRSIQGSTVHGGPYAKLMKFYDHLGVALKLHDYTYSFSSRIAGSLESKACRVKAHMLYNGDSGRAGVGVPSTIYAAHESKLTVLLDLIRWLFATLALVFHYIRLLFLSRTASRTPTHLCRETLRAWTQRTARESFISRMLGWEAFVANVIAPFFSAVCSTSLADVWDHPAAEILDYIWLTLDTHHYQAANGVRDIVSRLASPIPQRNIHLGTEVDALIANPSESTASVSFTFAHTKNSEVHIISGFSHIILATPTRRSASLIHSFTSTLHKGSPLRAPLEDAICKLDLFRTFKATVVTHRDASVLPGHRSDWRDLNLVLETSEPAHEDEKAGSTTRLTPGCAMATHIFPTPSGPPLCQTTNPVLPIHPESILSQSVLDRSVLTIESKVARDSFSRPLGNNEWTQGHLQGLKMHETEKSAARVWFCGAWAYGGIPLLEGCVGSAEIVVGGILKSEGFEHSPLI
ncbi:microfibrillar-associated protein [Rhizoctonia solani 123E]|uniref:Microfibrillar-associated protein n=1 Tax=Rhizoctonia solani 123E TaxID=1423351 RepID=A0A074S662_9AGAM|nr:microfibrillar-associated protein [Rhizoctonia solani 123E]